MLLGDSAHAMQPNLGQGGCMAIEDAYQLVLDLCEEAEKAGRGAGAGAGAGEAREMDVEGVLTGYTMASRGRVGARTRVLVRQP